MLTSLLRLVLDTSIIACPANAVLALVLSDAVPASLIHWNLRSYLLRNTSPHLEG